MEDTQIPGGVDSVQKCNVGEDKIDEKLKGERGEVSILERCPDAVATVMDMVIRVEVQVAATLTVPEGGRSCDDVRLPDNRVFLFSETVIESYGAMGVAKVGAIGAVVSNEHS